MTNARRSAYTPSAEKTERPSGADSVSLLLNATSHPREPADTR